MRRGRPRQIVHIGGLVVIVAALIAPHGHSLATTQAVIPASALSHINTVAVAAGDWPAYAATSASLYCAVSRSFTLWQG